MDEILDVCFDEELFTTPSSHPKRTKEKEIPTKNPYKFSKVLHPIYETQKMSKDSLANLCCRSTLEIKARDPNVKEEDILYHAFSSESGGSSALMKIWLHLFVRMHRKFFTTLGTKYFNSKGMTQDTWMEGIID